MIIMTILLFTLIACAIVATISIIIGAGTFMIAFGDIFVFLLIVWLIVKIFKKKSKKKES